MVAKRNSVKYNSVGLFLTEDGSEQSDKSINFLNRIQSASFSINAQRQNIKSIGSDSFADRKIVYEPTIDLNFEYLLTDGYEEKTLGLNAAPAPVIYTEEKGVIDNVMEPSGCIYNNLIDNKTAYMLVGEEGFDLTGISSSAGNYSGLDVISLSNCFIKNYSISAGVGSLAKASVTMVASDINYACVGEGKYGYSWKKMLDSMALLLRQSDINDNSFVMLEDESFIKLGDSYQYETIGGVENTTLNLIKGGYDNFETGLIFNPKMYNSPISAITHEGVSVKVRSLDPGGPTISGEDAGGCVMGSANIQDFNINIPFDREDLYGFGSMHVYGRKMKYPQIGTMSFNLSTSSFNQGRFSDIFCEDKIYEIEIDLKNRCCRSCDPRRKEMDRYMKFSIDSAKFESYSVSQDIGSIGSISCSFTFEMNKQQGLSISGCYNNPRSEGCGPTLMMSPRNMKVSNVTPLGQINAPRNLQANP